MSLVSSLADSAIGLLQKFATKSTAVTTVGTVTITAGGLESGLGTIGGFASSLTAAIKAKNYLSATEISLEEAATVADDVGAPYAGVAKLLLPIVFALINKQVIAIQTGQSVPDGQGGFAPKTNSTYDPKTGQFLCGPFS